MKSFLPYLLALFPLSEAMAGSPMIPLGKQPTVQPVPPTSPWEVTVRPYGWLAGLSGTTGILGYTVETDLPFKKILDNLDMVAALQLEVKRDRWMLLLDGMYLKMSAGGETPGRLLSTASVEIEQVMAEASIGYRLWEGKRGFLDAFAGVRYMHLGGEIGFNVDSAGVQSFSEDLSAATFDRLETAVRQSFKQALPVAKARLGNKINSIATELEARLQQRVDVVLGNHPNLPKAVNFIKTGRGPVSTAIRELVTARITEEQQKLTDAKEAASSVISASVAAAKARVRKQLRRAASRAEKQLAHHINDALGNAIPDRVSGSQDWVDPIIGLRGQYNFTDRLYAFGRGDIGGFGVGSDFAWQALGGLGWQASQRISVELGYRALQMDYTSGGFTYDTLTSGIYTAVGIKF